MAHPSLHNLFWQLQKLPQIGEKKLAAYKRLGCSIVRDLIFHFPYDIIDRRESKLLSGQIATLTIKAVQYNFNMQRASRAPHKIYCANEDIEIEIVYFNARVEQLRRMFPLNTNIVVSGKVEHTLDGWQMIHPDIVASLAEINKIKVLEPIYPATHGLLSRFLGYTIRKTLEMVPNLPEWLPHELLQQKGWLSWRHSLRHLHYPQLTPDINELSIYRERLAFDELLAQQITIQLARSRNTKSEKLPLSFSGQLAASLKASLPFALTEGQHAALQDIERDQKAEHRMCRLILGDVGSGKTIVALLAALNTIEAGKQVAIMAPTEILAKQHYHKITSFCQSLGVTPHLLISKIKKSEKKLIYQAAESGAAKVVIGTHSLIQDTLGFADLGLVVIDEQHRFGVEQRLSLTHKGYTPDFLMMSATPIPRTVCMVKYGDLDLTLIKDKPQERLAIHTSVISNKSLDTLVNRIKHALQQGEKIYWVCPLIEESEKIDLTNLNERFSYLEHHFPKQVGMVHGKMHVDERDLQMQRFLQSEIKLLVATTVIEVGVDVQDASIIIIENAERFGLSQLHQLRGRVGRGNKQSYCVLMHRPNISEMSYSRLRILRDSNDGFYLAEKDLELRGGGEILSTRQSGIPGFRTCNLLFHNHLIPLAHQLAQRIVAQDPELITKESEKFRILLELHSYDQNIRYIRDN